MKSNSQKNNVEFNCQKSNQKKYKRVQVEQMQQCVVGPWDCCGHDQNPISSWGVSLNLPCSYNRSKIGIFTSKPKRISKRVPSIFTEE